MFIYLLCFMCKNLTIVRAHFHIQLNLEQKRSPAKMFDPSIRFVGEKIEPKRTRKKKFVIRRAGVKFEELKASTAAWESIKKNAD
jgi:hypothetical protein